MILYTVNEIFEKIKIEGYDYIFGKEKTKGLIYDFIRRYKRTNNEQSDFSNARTESIKVDIKVVMLFLDFYKKKVNSLNQIQYYRLQGYFTLREAANKLIDELRLGNVRSSNVRKSLLIFCKNNEIEILKINATNKYGVIEMVPIQVYDKFKSTYKEKKRVLNADELEDYYSYTQVIELFKVEAHIVRYWMNTGRLSYQNKQEKPYFLKQEIDEIIKERSNSIVVADFCREIDKTRTFIFNLQKKSIIKIGKDRLTGYYTMDNKEAEKVREILNKEKIFNNAASLFEKYVLSTEDNVNNRKFSITKELLRKFTLERLNETKDNKFYVRFVDLHNILLNSITKEVILLENEEIIKLLGLKMSEEVALKLTQFLNFCKDELSVKYDVSLTYDKFKGKPRKKSQSKIYTKEEWKQMVGLFTSIDNNDFINKILDNRMLANAWLYVLLNLCVVWRRDDFYYNIPNPNLRETIGIKEEDFIHWIRLGNKFTISMAQKVVNDIQSKIEMLWSKAHKNDGKLTFIIPFNLVYAVGLISAICECHRARENREYLISSAVDDRKYHLKLFGDKYVEIFKEKSFSNKIANSSVLTYIDNVANEKELGEGYHYASILRGHKNNKRLFASSTEIYLKHTNKDDNIDLVSYNLFRRGTFGFVIKILLELACGDLFEKLSIGEKTEYIEELSNETSILNIEGISEFILQQRDKYKDLVLQMLNMTKDEILNVLKEISLGKSPSKMLFSQCLKKKLADNNCIFPTRSDCLGCQYLIPQIYFLTEFKRSLNNLLEKLNGYNSYHDRIRYSYSLYEGYLPVLQEANQVFNKYDKDYLNSFIDIKELQKKLVSLINEGKLINQTTLRLSLKEVDTGGPRNT